MPFALSGKHILITSGPTHAPIDAVRFISNRSSGRLGRRIAEEALGRGARVTMVCGPGGSTPNRVDMTAGELARLTVHPITTVGDLLEVLEPICTADDSPDAVVLAMAVLDYVPAEPSGVKTPSGQDVWHLALVRTPKVIRRVRSWLPDAFLVEHKLEVAVPEPRLIERAMASMRSNRADAIVANDLDLIRGDVHPALLLEPDGSVRGRPGTKGEIACALCDLLADRLDGEARAASGT